MSFNEQFQRYHGGINQTPGAWRDHKEKNIENRGKRECINEAGSLNGQEKIGWKIQWTDELWKKLLSCLETIK